MTADEVIQTLRSVNISGTVRGFHDGIPIAINISSRYVIANMSHPQSQKPAIWSVMDLDDHRINITAFNNVFDFQDWLINKYPLLK